VRNGLLPSRGVHLGTSFLDLVLPDRCVACGREGGLLCEECRADLVRLRGTLCARCGAPTAWPVERCGECDGRRLAFASACAAVAYDGPARLLVVAWKERGLRRVAALAADVVAEVVAPPRAAALTWIPGDPDRSAWRGVNSAEALAGELAVRWQLSAVPLLARVPGRPKQRGHSRAARRANVREAFLQVGTPPARVAVVDDVYTTGATAGAAAGALRRAGASVVHVVTFARAVRR
jgi:predicted amidophosphoribosyltransferase